jgi:hypothetical protein
METTLLRAFRPTPQALNRDALDDRLQDPSQNPIVLLNTLNPSRGILSFADMG